MSDPLIFRLEEYSRLVVELRPYGVSLSHQVENSDGVWGEVDGVAVPFDRVGDVCAFLARVYDAQVRGELPWRSP